MTKPVPDPDRILADLFAEDAPPYEPPLLIPALLARTALTPQRPAWRVPSRWLPASLAWRPRTHERSNTVLFAMRFAAMGAVLALTSGLLFATATLSPSPAGPGPSPTPSPIAMPGGDLEAGTTYAIEAGDHGRFLVTVPGTGWFAIGPGHFGKDVMASSDSLEGYDIRLLGPYFPSNINADPCAWTGSALDPPVGPTVDDLATALMEQPKQYASSVSDVTLGGYAGKMVELSAADGAPGACEGGNYQRWYDNDQPWDYGPFTWGSSQRDEVYIVDVEGTRWVIDTHYRLGVPESELAELHQLVESIRFEPPTRPAPSESPSDGSARNGRIAFGSENDIYTVAPDGSDRRLLVEGGSDTLAGLAWSPDGTRLAYWTEGVPGASPPHPWQLTVVGADGSDPAVVASGDDFITIGHMFPSVVDWSPDGSKLTLTAQTIDGPQRACVGASDPFPYNCTMRVFVVEVDADASTGPVQVGDPDRNALTAAWSLDGRTIAFTSGDAQKGGIGLHLMDADGSNVRRIDKVSDIGGSFRLARSPDGKSIAVTAGMGSRDIWVFPSDGSSETMASLPGCERSTVDSSPGLYPEASETPGDPTEYQGNPAYAPDGAVAWSGCLLEVGGTPRTMPVGAPPWSAPVWSPDGRFIAGQSPNEVVISDRDGTILARIEDASFEYRVSWQRLPG